VRPSADLVNVVSYTGYAAPPGYRCTDPAAGVNAPDCTPTAGDTLLPGEQRTFQFTITLFDPRYPYLHVDDTLVTSGVQITSSISASANVNPDSVVAESDRSNNASGSTATIQAPFIKFVADKGPDCMLPGGGPASVVHQPDGHVVYTGNWSCKVHIDTHQGSAPAHINANSLAMVVEASQFGPMTSRQVTTNTCQSAIESGGSAVQNLACQGNQMIQCTNPQDIDVAVGNTVSCTILVTVVLVDRVSGEGMGFDQVDVDPMSFELTSDIIRFASPLTDVKLWIDIAGGTVGWG